MALALFILVVVSSTAVGGAVYEVREGVLHGLNGPTPQILLVTVSAPRNTEELLHCDQRRQVSSVNQGSCAFYNSEQSACIAVWCPFLFPDNVLQDGMFSLSDSCVWKSHSRGGEGSTVWKVH